MLLSVRSPKLRQALRMAGKNGLHYLVLDGTLIRTDRSKADRPYFSGKHRMHGMNVQMIASPDGTILCALGALPWSVMATTGRLRRTFRPPARAAA